VTIVDIFHGDPRTGYMRDIKFSKEDGQLSSSSVVKCVIFLPEAQFRFAPGCCSLRSLLVVVGLENSWW
jgi:hypothetical protein